MKRLSVSTIVKIVVSIAIIFLSQSCDEAEWPWEEITFDDPIEEEDFVGEKINELFSREEEYEEDLEDVKGMLESAEEGRQSLNDDFNADARTLTQNAWLPPGLELRSECLKKLYAEYSALLQKLRSQIADANDKLQAPELTVPAHVMVFYNRGMNWWLIFFGITTGWARNWEPCAALLPGFPVLEKERIERALFYNIVRELQSTASWDEAINNAINDPTSYPGNPGAESDEAWGIYVGQWVECLRMNVRRWMRDFLRQTYPEASEAELERLAAFMWNAATPPTDREEQEREEYSNKLREIELTNTEAKAEIERLKEEIQKLIDEFWIKADECRREVERAQQKVWILEAFESWCEHMQEKPEQEWPGFLSQDDQLACDVLKELRDSLIESGTYPRFLVYYLQWNLWRRCNVPFFSHE